MDFLEQLGDLEQRLDTYGPFPPGRDRIVLFSTGCDREDHGPAMAPGSDTLFAQAFCSGAALRTGIRYIAHVPFTTDISDESFPLFCPVALTQEEFFEQTADYCAMILDTVNPRPEGVCIHIPWHGQQIMEKRIDEFASRLKVRGARLIADIVGDSLKRFSEKDYEKSSLRDLVREGIEGRHFQHAGFFDYCVAEALGHLDKAKLDRLRRDMERDLEGTLRKYPAVHNLAGYVRYGGPEFDGLRRALGLEPGDPPPPVDPKWQNSCAVVGRAMVRYTIDIMVEEILAFERKLFGDA
jgi:hypothetical protein